MKFNFSKTLLAGSIVAMGAFGLIACGDDSSSGPDSDPSGSQKPEELPTTRDDLIQFVIPSSRAIDDTAFIEGQIKLDATDTASANSQSLHFSSMELKVGKLAADGKFIPSNVTANHKLTFPLAPLVPIDLGSINSAYVTVDLKDPNFGATECGDLVLAIRVTATDGEKNFETNQTIPFNRSDDYCVVEAPESSSGVETPTTPEGFPMVACIIDNISTNMMPGVDLANCAAVPAENGDIVFKKTIGGDVAATANAGTQFTRIINEDRAPATDDYDADNWPEQMLGRPSYTSDFMYNALGTEAVSMIENSSQIYVAKTAAFNEATYVGFYAFAITGYREMNNGDFNITLTSYKVQ